MTKPNGTTATVTGTKVPAVCTTTGLDADVCFGACCCPPVPADGTFAERVAYTLHRAAAAYRVGEIAWGREAFIDVDGCRCALGAITYAVDPTATDGNPYCIADRDARNIAVAAADALAVYLVHELDAVDAIYGDHERDVPEVVANWNDEFARTPDEVAAALDAAAGHQA